MILSIANSKSRLKRTKKAHTKQLEEGNKKNLHIFHVVFSPPVAPEILFHLVVWATRV